MATVRQSAQRTGLTYVGDGKMAALGTRAATVAHQDDSLCPLSATQVPPAERDRLRDPVFTGMRQPTDIRLPNAHGQIEAMDDPVAVKFCRHGRAERQRPLRAEAVLAATPPRGALA